MLTRRRVVVARIEAAEGIMETITVTDAGILAISPKFEADFKSNPRSNVSTNSLSPLPPVMGAKGAKITFQAEVKGAGVAYSATVKPALSPFLRGCGFAETVDVTAGSEKVTYLPASSGVPSLTIWVYEDGVIKKARGCRGTVKFTGKVGEIVMADFSFDGVYDSTVDATMINPTYEPTTPPALLGTALSLDGNTSLVAESFMLDMANQIQLRPSIDAPDGYLAARITGRTPNGTLDPEMVTVATYDFMGKWKAGNQAALSVGPVVPPSGSYNSFTLSAPKAVNTKVGEGDRAGNQVAALTYTLAMNTGDDELQLQFVK